MSSEKKVKKMESKGETGTPSKGNQRTALEAVLRNSMMNVLESYSEDEMMALYERVKGMYDIVRTRTLLLPREKRLTSEEKEYMQEALAHLAKSEDGVVEGDEEDEEDEEIDIDQLDSESDDSDEEDEKISAYIGLFKKRLVLNDFHDSHTTAEDDDYMDFDGMDEDDFEGLEDDEEISEEEEAVVPVKKGKKGESSEKKEKQLAVSKRPVAVSDDDDEDDDEEGDLDAMLDSDNDDEEDGFALSRSFYANFSLLNADGKPSATDLVLESSDVYTGESGFQGTHQLVWNDEIVFALNVVDGDIVEPDLPALEDMEDLDDEDFDEEMMAGNVPNIWDSEVALALKQASGFPEELTALQFIVILTRVIARIVKNAARERGPSPADGLLPFLVLELAQQELEEDDDEEDVDGPHVEELSSDEEQEEIVADKKQQHHKKQNNNKSQQKPSSDSSSKKPSKQHQDKPQASKKSEPQQQTNKKSEQQQHKSQDKKEHKKSSHQQQQPQQQNKPSHNHNNDKKSHHHNNDKKRSSPHGDRDHGNKHQHKKQHGGKKH